MKYICIVSLFFFFCCKKSEWFDVKSDSSLTVPTTLTDFQYLLDDFTIVSQNTPGLGEVGSDDHYAPENSAMVPAEQNAYTWTNTLPNLKVDDWNKSYEKIFRCNLVLEGLKKINPASANELIQYNMIKGNALFHRAKNYFDLAQIYGQPYKASSSASDLGIPLRDGIDITAPVIRSSISDTYERIITDLLTAAELLPSISQLKSRGSKASAFGLLARTYLIMGIYDKAGAAADSSLSIYNTLLDFNKIAATVPNLGRFNAETIFYSQTTTFWFSIWMSSYVFVDPSLYALYSENDLRKTRFFTVNGGNIVFKGNYNNSTAGFSGLATDEQYLIKAECYARANNVVAAMKTLNDLLKTRWNNSVVYSGVTASSAEEALKVVLMERRKELLFRTLRWMDLRRLNLDDRFKVTFSHKKNGVTYTLEPNSYKYTLPIPDDVTAFSNITQSPGWVK